MYLIGNYTKRRGKSDRLYYIDLHVLQFSTKTTSVIYNFTMLSDVRNSGPTQHIILDD